MEVQISGVSGQMGSYLTEFLLKKGFKVLGFSRRCASHSTGRIDHLLTNPNFKYEEGDITDCSYVNGLLAKKPDWFINLAAQSHVQTSFSQVQSTFDIDAMGVFNILEALRLHSPKTVFYQASTSELFGSSYSRDSSNCPYIMQDGIFTQEQWDESEKYIKKYQDENTPFIPQSPYAIAKLAAHEMVKLYRRAYNLNCRCGIMFNFEGPNRGEAFVTRKITKWIYNFKKWLNEKDTVFEMPQIQTALDFIEKNESEYFFNDFSGQKFPKLRLGNLDAKRDWNYVGDTCEALYLIMNSEPDEYVIGSGEAHSVREFLDVAFEVSGLGNWEKYVHIDPALIRPAEVDYLCARPSKIKKLGWSPKVGFKELVTLMVEKENA